MCIRDRFYPLPVWYTSNRKFWSYWLDVMKELIDLYQPDLLYSDGALPFGLLHEESPESEAFHPGLEAVSYLYNRSIEKYGENRAVYTQKDRRPEIYQVGVLDIEKSQLPGVFPTPWQTDTCIGNWFYDCLLYTSGSSFELAAQALRAGYTSIMIDGSHEPFEGNIEVTGRVVSMAKPNEIPVEAELGKVGGKEDDLDGGNGGYTDPMEAKEFVERTGVSSLAVAIGTAHGVYAGEPKLDVERLKEIRSVVTIPLVLHGASGLSDEAVQALSLIHIWPGFTIGSTIVKNVLTRLAPSIAAASSSSFETVSMEVYIMKKLNEKLTAI